MLRTISRRYAGDPISSIARGSSRARRTRATEAGARRGSSTRSRSRPCSLQEGADDDLLAAALLHDVLEDTTVGRAELETAFGKDIADLVAQLSEDSSVEDYPERKARLREQVDAAGEDAAVIFLADKLARLQALDAPPSALSADTLEHYRKTLELLGSHYPQLPFIDELSRRLA